MRIPQPYRKTPRAPRKKKKTQPVQRGESAPPVVASALFKRNPRVLMVAVILLAAFGAALIFRSKEQMSDEDRAKRSALNLAMFSTALRRFKETTGRFPSTDEGLYSLWQHPADMTNWSGPYIAEPSPLSWSDYWETPYSYSCESGKVHLASAGPDRVLHTSDDLVAPPMFFMPSDAAMISNAIEEYRRKQEITE